MNAHTHTVVDEVTDWISIELGRRVRQLREQRKISQTSLGEAIGVSFQQVQKYERGTNRISAPALVGIAKAMHVSPAQLLIGLNDPDHAQPWPSVDPRLAEATAGLAPRQLDAVIAVARAFG